MTTPNKTTLHRFVDRDLEGTTVEELVSTGRPGQSWQMLAELITERSGIEVSRQNLMNWFPDADTQA